MVQRKTQKNSEIEFLRLIVTKIFDEAERLGIKQLSIPLIAMISHENPKQNSFQEKDCLRTLANVLLNHITKTSPIYLEKVRFVLGDRSHCDQLRQELLERSSFMNIKVLEKPIDKPDNFKNTLSRGIYTEHRSKNIKDYDDSNGEADRKKPSEYNRNLTQSDCKEGSDRDVTLDRRYTYHSKVTSTQKDNQLPDFNKYKDVSLQNDKIPESEQEELATSNLHSSNLQKKLIEDFKDQISIKSKMNDNQGFSDYKTHSNSDESDPTKQEFTNGTNKNDMSYNEFYSVRSFRPTINSIQSFRPTTKDEFYSIRSYGRQTMNDIWDNESYSRQTISEEKNLDGQHFFESQTPLNTEGNDKNDTLAYSGSRQYLNTDFCVSQFEGDGKSSIEFLTPIDTKNVTPIDTKNVSNVQTIQQSSNEKDSGIKLETLAHQAIINMDVKETLYLKPSQAESIETDINQEIEISNYTNPTFYTEIKLSCFSVMNTTKPSICSKPTEEVAMVTMQTEYIPKAHLLSTKKDIQAWKYYQKLCQSSEICQNPAFTEKCYLNSYIMKGIFISKNKSSEKSAQIWQDWVKWHIAFKPHFITKSDIKSQYNSGEIIVAGHDKLGRACIYCKPYRVVRANYDETLAYWLYSIEQALILSRSRGIEQIVSIHDKRALVKNNSNNAMSMLKIFKEVANKQQTYYPDGLYKSYILFPGWGFKMQYGMVKPLLSKEITKKLLLTCNVDDLLDDFEPEFLQKEYGGLMEDPFDRTEEFLCE